MGFSKAILWISAFMVLVEYCVCTTKLCSNPPPGVSKMARGIDITTLDLLPVNGFLPRGVKFPIIALTCNKGDQWTNPVGAVYERPDQVWSLTTIPHGISTAQAMVYFNYFDYRSWFNMQAGIEGEFYNLSFSGSTSYLRMEHAMFELGKQIEDVMSFEATSRADLIPYWQLQMDPYAQMYVNMYLPVRYNATTMQYYQKFIDLFGTHYFAYGNFGGIMRLFMETDYLYARYRSLEEIKAEAVAAFQGTMNINNEETEVRLSGSGKMRTGTTHVSELFYRATTFYSRYYGGNANLLTFKGLQKWHRSVDYDPWLFGGKLCPIAYLIRNPCKRRNMVRAVREHIWRAYLKMLYRLVVTTKLKVKHYILDRLQRQIEKLQQLQMIPHKRAAQVAELVFYHLVVPQWFVYDSYLCLKWQASSEEGKDQCNGGSGKYECTKPNGQTNQYLDDTRNLKGGCKMQWAVHSKNHPAWFANVSICFKYEGTGDKSQCGGSKKPGDEVCSTVNSFTPEYLDNTDDRPGGCKMSWKLKVHGDMPLWLQTAKICFEWSANGDSSQCMSALQPARKCVDANDWTPYYLDETDERQGGCNMSWGWYVPLLHKMPKDN